jgi:type III secretion protein J
MQCAFAQPLTAMNSGIVPRLGALLVTALAVGCSVPIAADLAEREANEAIVALEARGVYASKQPDRNAEGRWQLSVQEADAVEAVAVLSEEGLPARDTPGVLETLGQGSLVPSRTLEHVKWLAGTAGELETSLRGVDGVLSARVHLASPNRDALDLEQSPPEPSASVLLRYRGSTPPIAAGDVQRLVAGAVPGLDPKSVDVISSPAPPPRSGRSQRLAQLGPITVTHTSIKSLKALLGAAMALNLVLLGLLAWLWTRARRSQVSLGDTESSEAAAGES